jgi:hypothetical protein
MVALFKCGRLSVVNLVMVNLLLKQDIFYETLLRHLV